MKLARRRVLALGLTAVALVTTALGAAAAWGLFDGDPEAPFARFQPSEADARAALEAALWAWQQGLPPGRVPGPENPTVYVIDNSRRPEQKLVEFNVLGETAGEGPRCFAVKVVYKDPEEEGRVRFVVYGCDPLWVYRYEDYEMLMRWECGRDELIKANSAKKGGE